MKNRKSLKILHVVGAMNRAGTETMLMNIYRNIDREKVQFDFISYSPHEAHYDQEIMELGGRVIRLSKTYSIKEIYNAIVKYGPYDAVHSHTLFHCGIANIAAFMAGIKVRIAHAHTTLDKSNSFLRKIYINTMRVLISTLSTKLLACSKGAGEYLFGTKSLTRNKYSYFPNVIDYSLFLSKPNDEVNHFKKQEGIEDGIVIGHIGRFMEAKNHEFLLKIMKCLIKRIPTIKLLLVGDGELKQQIEDQAKEEGLIENIIFVGIRHDIHTMLHSMDIFVFPSLYEGLGLVLLEAQASGVPCIVSEAIQPEADLELDLISRHSLSDGPEIWANTILNEVNKKEKNIQLITNSFERSEYSIQLGVSKLMSIYNDNGGAHEEYFNCLF